MSVQKGIKAIAKETAELYATGLKEDKEEAARIYRVALERFGLKKFEQALLTALANRAAQARRNQEQGVVCRLKEVAYSYGVGKDAVRAVFKRAGAIGWQPADAGSLRDYSMFTLSSG